MCESWGGNKTSFEGVEGLLLVGTPRGRREGREMTRERPKVERPQRIFIFLFILFIYIFESFR